MKTVRAKNGTPNIQRSFIKRHSDSEMHIEALRLFLREKTLLVNADLADDVVESTQVSDPDLFFIRTVYWTIKEELPLDKVNALLDLQRLNKTDIPYRNLSWDTVTEIQNTISMFLKQKLVTKLSQSVFFCSPY